MSLPRYDVDANHDHSQHCDKCDKSDQSDNNVHHQATDSDKCHHCGHYLNYKYCHCDHCGHIDGGAADHCESCDRYGDCGSSAYVVAVMTMLMKCAADQCDQDEHVNRCDRKDVL